jgi:hypothetical protein
MTIETRIEESAQILYLSRTPEQAGDMMDAVTLGQGLPDKDELGNPIKYKWTRCAQIGGKYMATVKDPKTGKLRKSVLDCSASNVNQWLKAFEDFKKAGIKVPITKGHFERTSDDGRGYGIALRKNNGWLEANMQLIGDDAIKSAGRNEVSIGVKPNYTDRDGKEYGDAIEHIALTLFPVVPGQSTANQTNGLLAASRADGEDEPIVFTLSGAEETPATPEKETPMADKTSLSKAHRAAMADAMKMADDGGDDDAMMSKYLDHGGAVVRDAQKVKTHNDNLKNAMMNMSMDDLLSDENEGKLPTLQTEVKALRDVATAEAAEVARLKGEVQNLSREEADVDPELFRGFHELKTEKVDLLLRAGRITAFTADKLKKKMVNDKGEPNTYLLSKDDDLGGERPIDFILDLLDTAESGPGKSNDLLALSRDDHPANKVDINQADAAKAEAAAKASQVDPVAYAESCRRLNLPTPTAAA